MDTDALVETLEAAGLSPYQANAYVALLELGVASATEIAAAGDVPAPRIYDVLRSLEDMEYVETYEKDTLRARAHSPSDILADLRERADRLDQAADEVEERWEEPELEGNDASIVKRFRTVIHRAESFVEEASHQILLSTTPRNFERLTPALRAAHERGVSVRVLVQTEADAAPPPAETFAGVCSEARHRALPGAFVLIADRRRASFANHPDAYDRYGVLVDDRTHAFVFYWYFLTCLWDPWEAIYAADGEGLPVEYVNIRHCVRDLWALDDDAEARLHVEGYDVSTGEQRDLVGRVEGVHTQVTPEEPWSAVEMAGQVTIDLDVDGETVSVGGWGAMLEDVEAMRVSLLEVGVPLETLPSVRGRGQPSAGIDPPGRN